MLNSFIPHIYDAVGVSSMKIIDWMEVPVLFTSLLFIHPCMKVRSAWMAGSFRLSRVLMHL